MERQGIQKHGKEFLRYLGSPSICFFLTMNAAHLIEELVVYQVPQVRDLFTQITGMHPWDYTKNHLSNAILIYWGPPFMLGISAALLRRRQLRRDS